MERSIGVVCVEVPILKSPMPEKEESEDNTTEDNATISPEPLTKEIIQTIPAQACYVHLCSPAKQYRMTQETTDDNEEADFLLGMGWIRASSNNLNNQSIIHQVACIGKESVVYVAPDARNNHFFLQVGIIDVVNTRLIGVCLPVTCHEDYEDPEAAYHQVADAASPVLQASALLGPSAAPISVDFGNTRFIEHFFAMWQ